jgi:hypothetical protein
MIGTVSRPAALLLLATALAGCGEGSAVDREVLKAYRESAIRACVQAAGASTGDRFPAELVDRLCVCTTDRTMQGRAAADLATLVPGGAETRAAATSCIRDLAPASATAMQPVP